jgi:hypothetical protein
MKKLDLTQTEDIIHFAKHYIYYKSRVNLPQIVIDEIETVLQHYNNCLITSNEMQNQIIDIIYYFIKGLDIPFNK